MLISVALATYNGARYLQEQLESIAAQTLLPGELVISDDGSTDDTLSTVSFFAQTAPFPVRVLPRDQRRGFADNFLHCARSCHNELIAFCDQDDVWQPDKLAIGCSRLEADGSLLAIHRLILVNQNLQVQGVWTQGIEADAVFEPLVLDPYINGWGNTMLFRRELVSGIPYDHRPTQPEAHGRPMSHDFWIYTLAAALGRVSHITEPLILYRQHGNNAMGIDQAKSGSKTKAGRDFSLQRLRDRMVFYRRMAELFAEIAQSAEHRLSPAAQAAAERYTERYAPLAARFAIYDSPSLASRLRAFSAMNRTQRLTAKSRIKALMFGVTGLHTLLG